MAEKKLTPETSFQDFQKAYRAKSVLIKRQKEDFLFRLGKQWNPEKEKQMREAGINPVVDNRIQPNIFLITGLERQNRSEFKAFPDGEEDSIKAEIATALFKDSIKKSDFGYKKSEAFEDGVTCGESDLELYLDNTYNLLNAQPCWKKLDSNMVFPEPTFKEYDYSDARYIYKLTINLSKDDLISLFPDKKNKINTVTNGKINFKGIMDNAGVHNQPRDYPKSNQGGQDATQTLEEKDNFDLLERYYKKFVEKSFIGDRQTGEIRQANTPAEADNFISQYKNEVDAEKARMHELDTKLSVSQPQTTQDEQGNLIMPHHQPDVMAGKILQNTQARDPNRFIVIKRSVPEIWYFASIPGLDTPLADEIAWFYPNWKKYPIIPYFAHYSTAPLDNDDRHLLIQGIVHGVKGVQEKHNSSETLKLMHLNSTQNSGWLSEEDVWVDQNAVKEFGTKPGINLEYKRGRPIPERQIPVPLSQAHSQIAAESAEAIKAILGINSDLLAMEQGGADSGRAIALRQRQGLVMVQKLFDNLARTAQICGKFLLSQLGELYDTETAKKVLGEAFLQKNFPPPMQLVADPTTGQPQIDPATGAPKQVAMTDPQTGQPMTYDTQFAELAIAEVLSGNLEEYDVTVGEAVASETMRMAQFAEMKEIAQLVPGAISPEIIIENSDLPSSMKQQVVQNLQAQQAALQAQARMPSAKTNGGK